MRTAYHVIEGKEAPEDAFTDVRGTEGSKVREFTLGGATLRTCTVSGLGNAGKLLDELKAGKVHYDFVEVMACPGGCVGGGGPPLHDGEERADYWAISSMPSTATVLCASPTTIRMYRSSIRTSWKNR